MAQANVFDTWVTESLSEKNRNIYEMNILQQKFTFQSHHNKRQKEFLRAFIWHYLDDLDD